MRTKLEALELRIREHPGNPESSACSGDPSDEEAQEFRNLKRDRANLVKEISDL
jgi:hypothetical protein